MRTLFLCAVFGIILSFSATTQNVNNIPVPEIAQIPARKTINVPDILGYKTLKCDFHMHTVFSDGVVWPTFRVDEAWEQGLDVIAITDHIEGNPSKKQVKGDHNESYEIAAARGREKNILVVHAGEITRDMPPGHFNALFLNDVNPLDKDDYMKAFEEAKKQGAYIIWNHPGWKAQQPDTTKWWPVHTELYNKGMLHAIEVFNYNEWYPIALDWCIDKEIAVTAASDVHGIVSQLYDLKKYNRPMTLVLSKERTIEATREALFANRTIAWYGDNLAGKEEYLKAFFNEAIEVSYYDSNRKGKNYIVRNSSDIPFAMQTENGPEFTIPANGETMVLLPKNSKNSFVVKNLYTKGAENLKISLDL